MSFQGLGMFQRFLTQNTEPEKLVCASLAYSLNNVILEEIVIFKIFINLNIRLSHFQCFV